MDNSVDYDLMDIQELTDLLRTAPSFKELRGALATKGFSATDVLLAGYLEDEYWNEYGAIVTKAGEVYDFKKSTRPPAPLKFKKFNQVKDVDTYIQEFFHAVQRALQLIAEEKFF